MNYLKKVSEFHETFNCQVLDNPTIPADRAQLRVDLLQEELNELKEAIEANDMVEVADALTDLQYVLSGAVLEFGLKDKFTALFDEVHRSNMSKGCVAESIARSTVEYYEEKGVDAYYIFKNDRFVIFRRSDDKVLKSLAYSPANLRPIVESVKV